MIRFICNKYFSIWKAKNDEPAFRTINPNCSIRSDGFGKEYRTSKIKFFLLSTKKKNQGQRSEVYDII
jgi:hypothetical protein